MLATAATATTDERAVSALVFEFEDQLSGLVEGVVGIFDFALFDELAVEVTALVANTTWDVHGKDTPLDGNNALKIDESMNR